jgi:hypothetical protein
MLCRVCHYCGVSVLLCRHLAAAPSIKNPSVGLLADRAETTHTAVRHVWRPTDARLMSYRTIASEIEASSECSRLHCYCTTESAMTDASG